MRIISRYTLAFVKGFVSFPKIERIMIAYYSINGKITPAGQAALRLNDLSILRGYGIFDYFLVKSGIPVFLEDYLERFTRSASLLYLDIPPQIRSMASAIYEFIHVNWLSDASIRLVLTGGYADDGYTPQAPNLLIMEHPHPDINPLYYTDGIALMSYDFQRELPEVKSINYLTGIRLLGELRRMGAQELLYHDRGVLRESARSNVFVLTADNVLVTPADKVLLGVTRKKILELAAPVVKTEERDITFDELLTAKEVYLTSTTKGIMPVVKVDDKPVGNGRPGELAHVLQQKFLAFTHTYLEQKK